MGILKGTYGAQAAGGQEPSGPEEVSRVKGSGSPNAAPEASHPRSDDVEAQLRARQVDAIQRLSAPLMIVILVNVVAMGSVLWTTGELSRTALVWSALVCAVALYPLTLSLLGRRRTAPRTASVQPVRRIVRNSALLGLIWAIPGVTFVPELAGFSSVFAYILLTGMVAGGAFGLYPIPAAARAFLFPVAIGTLAGIAWTHGILALGPTIVAGMFLYIFHGVIRRHGDLFVSEFVNRLELERRNRLIEDLLEDARLEVLGTRQMIEERLARSEKTEAIGQLTGGIAHNFNNLLTAIQGHAELLELEGRGDRALIEPILTACRTGAGQVQRLLSIAGKQVLRPQKIRPASLFTDLGRIVEPALGPDYRIRTRVAAGALQPYADPAQLEGALVNLIFNARDAMPGGGEIAVTCRNAEGSHAGSFVDISVSDKGVGMDEATRDRATDPFFTTKPIWEATGLGLSSVAGFVRQSNGEMTIDTAPGKGTTVTLRLPATDIAPQEDEPERPASDGVTKTVLVVEDMADVRKVTVEMLKTLGYRVLAASGPDEAMRILAGTDRIDVMLTDILLSDEVTGIQLARNVRKIRSDLPTVFVSGWSRQDPAIEESAGSRVLPKPFTRGQLEDHIRHALAEHAAGRS